ncbi:MAG: AraC family transcriptional regulator ligand-binding domain-containing protein [Myxococcales bacterium]|nr:AraC family transcriptional regulator ligand-binding domain-containing protein [Myxococcales bacterium]
MEPATPPDLDPADDGSDRVLASMVLGTIAGLSTLGLATHELVECSGLPPEALQDPDALVEYEALHRLWVAALERLPGRPVGLTLARQGAQARREALGVFGYALRHCRDVRQSIELFIRYAPMAFPRLSLRLEVVGDEARLVVEPEPRVQALVEPVELFVASLALGLPGTNPRAPRPSAICFAHAPRHPAEVYADVLGDGVRFEAGWSGLTFAAAGLDLPITGADPNIGRYLQQHAELQLRAHAPISSGASTEAPTAASLEDRVRALIDDALMAGTSDQASVAKALGLGPRTLQRRLEERGTSFGRLREQVRRERALELLALPRLSVGEVAFMLGYANPRAFYRCFRRWTGQTPTEYRRAREG